MHADNVAATSPSLSATAIFQDLESLDFVIEQLQTAYDYAVECFLPFDIDVFALFLNNHHVNVVSHINKYYVRHVTDGTMDVVMTLPILCM